MRCGTEYDVIVAGGGVAGVAAAVAAARQGGRVLLLEKSIALGGLATIGLISWFEPLCNGAGHQLTGGIPEELLRVFIRYGFDTLPEGWREKPAGPGTCPGRYASYFSPTMAILALDEYLGENGVELMLDMLVTGVEVTDGRCRGVWCEGCAGREYYTAGAFVDATGSAALFRQAGLPTRAGENYLSCFAHYANRENAAAYAGGAPGNTLRQWLCVGGNLYGDGHPQGLGRLRCETPADETQFVLEGRRLLLWQLKQQARDARDILALPMMPQYRKLNRIAGEYTFTGREEGVYFDDAVGAMGDFRSPGKQYTLPLRALYTAQCPNLFAAGRIISADGDGWEITRVIPVAALSGQAAGVAAALCAGSGCGAQQLDLRALQRDLRRQGVLFPDDDGKTRKEGQTE